METLVINAKEIERSQFYKKTYSHVAMAILAFILVETVLLKVVPEEYIYMMVGQKYSWLLIIGAVWLASMLANKWTLSQSRSTQYLGLGLYVILQAIIFLPLLYMATAYTTGDVIYQAAILTLALFGGLTAFAFLSNKDFSFLRSAIVIGGFVALGLIVAGTIFGFDLGLWFSVGMVLLASASILYETSKLKNVYNTEQYVGASLQLFASIMLLFWYILRILMSRRS